MMRAGSPPPSALELVSLPAAAAALRPLSPRSALAATYATYVVRVHTRHGIKTISFDVLAAFFTYTAKKAAEDLGISSRTLIRVCRSLGIRRWPYLGFRSEKNVERIRQEAIENLRRKLERESSEAAASSASAASSSPTAAAQSCLRGASAKRLLQVKLPAHAAFQRPSVCDFQSADAVHHHRHYGHSHSHTPTQATAPLLTPPPSHAPAFDLGMRPSVSPRARPYATYKQHSHLRHQHQQYQHPAPSSPSSCSSASSAASSPSARSPSHAAAAMPSLSVLLEASILTAFKHEVESHLAESAPAHEDAPRARTMSMRDILNSAPVTA